ncbi:MAG: YitT family protein [Bacteroidales bacterium]|nr:YitT family protein [Bacteroidales bacterium]
MAVSSSTILRGVKEYLLITLGIVIYTVGWAIFLTPNNLIGGGVSGISAIIQYATGLKMGYSYFVINTVLLIISVIIIGPAFGAKTVYAIILASVCLNVFQSIIPETIIQDFALSNGKLMCSIIGGSMAGVGIGMSISQGGSTGGTDIIAMIITKFRNISPGRIILIIDVFIISSSLLFPSFDASGQMIPFDAKFSIAVYGMIIVTVNGYVVDLYLAGSKQSVQLFILSRHFEEIADMIARDFHRGVTILNGEGWYTKQPASVLMVITRKTDLNLLLRSIKRVDPDAFLSISSVSGVYGQGFDSIKGAKKS